MVFNSYTFILFFCGVMLLHYSPISWQLKKFNLLWASYLFYAAWNPPFVLLLWFSTLVDWVVAKRLYTTQLKRNRLILLLITLSVNLGMLAFFKYGNFILDNFINIMHGIGIEYQPLELDIILPVGISFYTFQTLSYTLDIYFRRAKPWHSFLDYAMYVTFFPQLVAGPIVRSSCFLPQCIKQPKILARQIGWGLSLLALGLFEKVVLADSFLAPVVESVYNVKGQPDMLAAWIGTIAFAGQIFCDFAGYSTCAIGVAMCLGFKLPDNFRFPYAAIGFSDFWKRWHISLSSWLRDYLYIPLGGNRKGWLRTHMNLMITMLIGGLWHGASWTFVVWGALHGMYLIIERNLRIWIPDAPIWHYLPVKLILGLLTFALICLTWVFFRAETFGQAFSIVAAMLGADLNTATLTLDKGYIFLTVITMSLILFIHWVMRDTSLEEVAARCPAWLQSLVLVGILTAIIITPGEDRAFIYFQF